MRNLQYCRFCHFHACVTSCLAQDLVEYESGESPPGTANEESWTDTATGSGSASGSSSGAGSGASAGAGRTVYVAPEGAVFPPQGKAPRFGNCLVIRD